MTIQQYQENIKTLKDTETKNLYISSDFQSDVTLGFPTMLCVNWEKGIAWLELNTSQINENDDIEVYLQACADYGFRKCTYIDRFNTLLERLGKDAYETAMIYTEDMDEQTM